MSISHESANANVDRVPAALRGAALLRNPHANKFTAFTAAEREELGLTGPLPEQVETEDAQIDRVLRQIDLKAGRSATTLPWSRRYMYADK
jgi:malate dehydrogenase (oxaloacetate-decarboxylating)(NADP+)